MREMSCCTGFTASSNRHKGTFQKLLGGFFPWGYPPFPLRVFGQDDFPLRGREVPPISAKENSTKKQVLHVQELHFFVFFHTF